MRHWQLLTGVFVFLAVTVWLGLGQARQATAIWNCCEDEASVSGPAETCDNLNYCNSNVQKCCYPEQCSYDGKPVAWSYCGNQSNVCCQVQGGCSSVCGNVPIWTWCQITDCLASANPNSLDCRYSYTYQTTACNAVDSCYPGSSPYLYAALCLPSGCAVGGQYKTCCKNDGSGVAACIGGQYSGGCPAGSSPVVNCVGPGCCSGTAPTSTPGPSPTPGGQEARDANESAGLAAPRLRQQAGL